MSRGVTNSTSGGDGNRLAKFLYPLFIGKFFEFFNYLYPFLRFLQYKHFRKEDQGKSRQPLEVG